jgi:hypothetical protein
MGCKTCDVYTGHIGVTGIRQCGAGCNATLEALSSIWNIMGIIPDTGHVDLLGVMPLLQRLFQPGFGFGYANGMT